MNIKEAYLKGFEAGYEFKISAGDIMGNVSIAQAKGKVVKRGKRGKNRGPVWTLLEDEILHDNEDLTPSQLLPLLPNRSRISIQSRRNYLRTRVLKRDKKVDNYDGLVNLGQKLNDDEENMYDK